MPGAELVDIHVLDSHITFGPGVVSCVWRTLFFDRFVVSECGVTVSVVPPAEAGLCSRYLIVRAVGRDSG